MRLRAAGAFGPGDVVGGLRLDADDPGVRVQRLGGGRGAGDEPAAPDGDEEQVERAGVLDELEGRGALAGHDERIVVGVDDRRAALGRQRGGERLAVIGSSG